MRNKIIAFLTTMAMTVSGFTALVSAEPEDESTGAVQDEVITNTLSENSGSSDDIIFEGEDLPPESIGDEPGAADAVPDEVIVSDEALAGIEELKKLELNATNIRLAIYALEAERLIWPEDFSNEELEQMFEGATMETVVDQILEIKSNAGVSTMALQDNTTITVTYDDKPSEGTYTVKYGNSEVTNGTISYKTNDTNNLVIEAVDGYIIKSVRLQKGSYKSSTDDSQVSLINKITENGKKLEITSDELKKAKEGNNNYFDSEGAVVPDTSQTLGFRVDWLFTIVITTAKADPGTFTVTEKKGNETIDNGDALYSVSGAALSNKDINAKALQNALNDSKGKFFEIKNTLTFTVDSSKIASVSVKKDGENDYTKNFTANDNTFELTVSEKDTTIEFTYKSTVSDFSLSNSGTITSTNYGDYVVNVNCAVYVDGTKVSEKLCDTYDSLVDYIKGRYVGETIYLTFSFVTDSNATIQKATIGDTSYAISGNTINKIELKDTNELNITLTELLPTVQTINYGEKKIVVGQLTNYKYLTGSTLQNITEVGFDVSVEDSTNPSKDKYNKFQTAERSGDVWAMQFIPKNTETQTFQHKYIFNVNAAVKYNSKKYTDTSYVTINIAEGEQMNNSSTTTPETPAE